MKLEKTLIAALLIVCMSSLFAQESEQTPRSDSNTSVESKKTLDAKKDADNKEWVKSVDAKQFAEKEPDSRNAKTMNELKAISNNIQTLKSDVIELNKDLRQMEEKLLFPSNTRFSVFVSLTTGQFFQLESVKLKLDGKLVSTQMFSEKQRAALSRGGIHKLYVTNLNEGLHTATAFFTGVGPEGRPYKRAASIEFEKGIGSEYLELAVVDDGATQEAVFQMKRW